MTVYTKTPEAYTSFHYDGANLDELNEWGRRYSVGTFEQATVGGKDYLFLLVRQDPYTRTIGRYWPINSGVTVSVQLSLQVEFPEEGGPVHRWIFAGFSESGQESEAQLMYDEVYQPIPNLAN